MSFVECAWKIKINLEFGEGTRTSREREEANSDNSC